MKEIEFELKGNARFYATDIDDAFKKLAEYFSNLARLGEDKNFEYEDTIFEPGTKLFIEPVENKED
ncbi:MAG: hypothetical protein WDA59_10295 [Methanofastidiosum sp.]|jgi:hypothetical protein